MRVFEWSFCRFIETDDEAFAVPINSRSFISFSACLDSMITDAKCNTLIHERNINKNEVIDDFLNPHSCNFVKIPCETKDKNRYEYKLSQFEVEE